MLVTAIDEGFFKPLVALRNSVRMHSSCTPIACYVYGDDDLARRVEALGIEVRLNSDISDHLPEGEGTEDGCKPMYARLLAPMDFGDCAWFDADQIVQTNLRGLFDLKFDEPIAAVPAHRPIRDTVRGMYCPEGDSIYSGLMRFNAEAYRKERVFERCVDLMARPGVLWRFVVQSVLSVVLADRFYRLDKSWQGFANRYGIRTEEFKVLHWHGRAIKPWTHPTMPNASIWNQYYTCTSS